MEMIVAGLEKTPCDVAVATIVVVLVAARVAAGVGVTVAARGVRASGVCRFVVAGGAVWVGALQLMSMNDGRRNESVRYKSLFCIMDCLRQRF